MKQITFKQYKAIDIAILSVLHFVFEALGIYASKNWFSMQAVVISFTPLVVAVMMMRWSEFAFVPAILGGIAYCLGGGGNIEQYVIYSLGNLLGLLSLLIIKKVGKEKIRAKNINVAALALVTYLFIIIGRWIVSLVFEPSFASLLTFLTTDIMSLVVAVVGLVALRTNDGMIEDQKSYLIRLDREKREEQERRAAMTAPGIYGDYDDDDYDDDDLDDDLDDDDDDGIIYDDPVADDDLPPCGTVTDCGGVEADEEPPTENENNEEIISEDKI